MVAKANKEIEQRCADLEVPERLRPGLGLYWSPRGENGTAARRAELRKVAQSRVDAEAKKAKHHIDVAAQEVLERLMMGALESAEARAFLELMPTAESLMAPISLPALEASPEMERATRSLRM